MIRLDLKEPMERLGQFIYELQVLGEIQDKILEASISELSPVEEVQQVTVKAINYLSGTIRALSDEILQGLKE